MHRLIWDYTAGRIARRDVKRETAHKDRRILERFATTFGQRQVKNLSKTDIERWIATRAYLAPGSRRHDISVMRAFTKWLVVERKIGRDPMIFIKNPRMPRRVPRALSGGQTVALLAVLPDTRAQAIVALMLWCGLRRCEVVSLQIGDWNREASVLHVIGKGDNEREVPVTPRVTKALEAYTRDRPASAGPLIRRHDRPTPLIGDYISVMMRRWMIKAGIKEHAHDGKGCHSLRHTLASNVVDVEPDLRVTQQLLGHASLTSTEIYLRRARLTKIRAAMEAAA